MPRLPVYNGEHLREGQAGADGLPAVLNGAVGVPAGGGADTWVLSVGKEVLRVRLRKGPENRPLCLNHHGSMLVRTTGQIIQRYSEMIGKGAKSIKVWQ